MNIRKAKASDIPYLIEFQKSMALETENITLDEKVLSLGLAAMFTDPSKGTYFIAEDEGEVIGCHMITYEWSDWRNGNVWWIQSLFVKEGHRKKGVFKEMYQNLVKLASNDPAVRGIRLYVDKTNAKAQQAYESIGMNGEHYTVFEWMKN
jgi:RimJ/RimL family protein N-acetyltransferase